MVTPQFELLNISVSFADYLDNKNYKKAVQEADRVLKKQKDLQCAKVKVVLRKSRMIPINRPCSSHTAIIHNLSKW
jgi:hypothetical protein